MPPFGSDPIRVVVREQRGTSDFTGPDADPFWRELLGNGFFVVVAWVGLWYPLDLLFIARQPLKRELRVLTELKALPVVVLTRSTATPTGAAS
ncbi:MAG: hypothetical protein ACRDTD_00135 [Pseudonocardiaceae bacterium]